MTTTPLFREPYEVDTVPECKVGDYVRFIAIIESHEFTVTSRRGVTGHKNVKTLVAQGGSGQVRSFAKTRANVVTPRNMRTLEVDREVVPTSARTARIDAGPMLGVVTAVLHGAERVGEQLSIGAAS